VKTLTIATRESQLALWQANFIRSELERHHPGLEVRLLGMRTRGDRWLNAPLREVGGKGLFIKELEEALLSGEAQIAVHSMKDLPAEVPDGFVLAATGFREDVRDVIVGVEGGAGALKAEARVGTSSLRRQAQLLRNRPDLDVQPIRGNVDTRLNKLAQGEYDAIVLAAAGLTRLGITPQ
jgi:hydroxymethylbilane synthase